MTFTCATYNILHGYHRDMILENIRFLIAQGADVVCLQEAEVKFERSLEEMLEGPDFASWKVRFAHAGLGGNVAILWNSAKLSARDMNIIHLPKLQTPISLRRLRGLSDKINRIALAGVFEANGHTLQVTNTHLDWEGGAQHRMRQLRHLRQAIDQFSADFRIITGDFNTIAPRPLRRMHERRVERTLGAEFRNAFPRLKWTYDISYTDPSNGTQFIATLARAGLKWRQRFDYMFAKDMTVISGEMHDLPGSDHRPLIATFGLLQKETVVQ